MNEPRAMTPEEVRKIFMESCKQTAAYWGNLEGKTQKEACEGLLFSIFVTLDGGSGSCPFAVTTLASVHPDDKQYNIDQGTNWIEPGTDFTSVQFHEEMNHS